MKNHSPWIHELRREREAQKIDRDIVTDVVVVGAGIAGVSTAFFLLTETNKNVVLVDRYMLAHGATGHNAGYLATYFERGFKDMVKEFGLDATARAHSAVESAWELLDYMYKKCGLTIPVHRFTGQMGVATKARLLEHLENNRLRKQAGLDTETILIAEHLEYKDELTPYADLYKFVSHEEVLSALQTQNSSYIAVFAYDKGTANSALLSEGIYNYLAKNYKKRFSLYEHTDIRKVVLSKGGAVLDAGDHTITCEKVVLCTNGFEHVQIISDGTMDVDKSFHRNVSGVVGYMSAYLETMNKPPFAASYFGENPIDYDDDYYYLSRRQYEYDGKKDYNLISIGGPVYNLEDRRHYMMDYEYPEEAKDKIDGFVKSTYDTDPNKKIDYQFTWHGLMGYTENKIRLIGEEPRNMNLLYNLGCNGLGLLPSIYGGKRIADILSGRPVEPMIFDPK